MGSTAIIFPGQGSQSAGMGRDVADSSQRARAVFDRASELLGFDLARLCFEGPAEKLEQTDIQQPAIFVTSVAIWEAFLEAGLQLHKRAVGNRLAASPPAEQDNHFARFGKLSLGHIVTGPTGGTALAAMRVHGWNAHRC